MTAPTTAAPPAGRMHAAAWSHPHARPRPYLRPTLEAVAVAEARAAVEARVAARARGARRCGRWLLPIPQRCVLLTLPGSTRCVAHQAAR